MLSDSLVTDSACMYINPRIVCQEAALTRHTVLKGDTAEKELGLACLVSSYALPHQNSQPGERGQETACSKVLSRRARDM